DGLPIRRNGRLGVVGGLLGQLHGVRAGDRLQENLAVTGALRVEYYRLTVGRERRVAVRPRRVGEPPRARAVRVHAVDLGLPAAGRGAHDPPPIRGTR